MKLKRLVTLLIPLFLFSACASLTERTETMLQDGRIDEALELVENARKRDPTDPTTAALERRVRLQWISDKLIQVRLSRLAESKGESIELMRKILKNENEWAMIPTGAVYATQAEESVYLSEYVQKSIYEALAEKRPLEAAVRYRENRILLEDLLKIETVRLKSAIVAAGNAFCKTEASTLKDSDFYTARFLKNSCAEFQNRVALPKTKNSVTLFRTLTPKINLEKLPPERATDFARDLKAEFEKSIWYDAAASKSLELTLTGPVTELIETAKVYRSQPYTVRVAYEEKSVRKKETKGERTGIETLFAVVAWALTTYAPDREVDNRDGTITVYQTKYRDETRYFPYEALEVTQTLSVDWKIALSPQAQSRIFEFKDQARTISDEHSVNFPDAKLEPQTRKLVRPSDWLVSLNRKLMDRIGGEFNNAWIERFCKTETEIANVEVYHRCIYGANGHAPSFVNEWFMKRYGIEIETWRQLALVHK